MNGDFTSGGAGVGNTGSRGWVLLMSRWSMGVAPCSTDSIVGDWPRAGVTPPISSMRLIAIMARPAPARDPRRQDCSPYADCRIMEFLLGFILRSTSSPCWNSRHPQDQQYDGTRGAQAVRHSSASRSLSENNSIRWIDHDVLRSLRLIPGASALLIDRVSVVDRDAPVRHG